MDADIARRYAHCHVTPWRHDHACLDPQDWKLPLEWAALLRHITREAVTA
jgi:hypothetical protein